MINLLALFVTVFLAGILLAAFAPNSSDSDAESLGLLVYFVWLLAVTLPTFTLTLRRVRDATGTGWWLLLVFVPFIGWIIILVIALVPSKPVLDR